MPTTKKHDYTLRGKGDRCDEAVEEEQRRSHAAAAAGGMADVFAHRWDP